MPLIGHGTAAVHGMGRADCYYRLRHVYVQTIYPNKPHSKVFIDLVSTCADHHLTKEQPVHVAFYTIHECYGMGVGDPLPIKHVFIVIETWIYHNIPISQNKTPPCVW